MGTWAGKSVDATLAVINGTDEGALNPEGTFAVVGRGILHPEAIAGLSLAGSVIASDDSGESGESGFATSLFGWMAEARFEQEGSFGFAGYVGGLTWDDDNAATDDDLFVAMGQASVTLDRLQFGGRVSAWMPEDDDASGDGLSPAIPNPGLAVFDESVNTVTDRKVYRFQLGSSYAIDDALKLRVEGMFDDYDDLPNGSSTDVLGIVVALNGRF